MIIISSKPGQLGNRLIVFAHFIAFSLEHKIKIYNPSFDEYSVHFVNTKMTLIAEHPLGKLRLGFLGRWFRSLCYRMAFLISRILSRLKVNNRFIRIVEIDWSEKVDLNTTEFIRLAQNTVFLFVHGWQFRDSDNIVKHGRAIANYLAPLASYEQNIKRKIDSVRKADELLIGVHIRQGDYKEFEGGKYYYTTEEYAGFMKELKDGLRGKKISFWICSNEKQPVSYFSELDCHWSTNNFIEDLVSLSMCDYIIGPPSTFSMWASFYGQKPLLMIKVKSDVLKIENATISLI